MVNDADALRKRSGRKGSGRCQSLKPKKVGR